MCDCDWEYPEFHRASHHTANKSHKCSECGDEIKPGDRYFYETMKQSGELASRKVCRNCQAIEWYLTTTIDCFCPAWGNLYSEIDDCCIIDYCNGKPVEYPEGFQMVELQTSRRTYWMVKPQPWLTIAFDIVQEKAVRSNFDNLFKHAQNKAKWALKDAGVTA